MTANSDSSTASKSTLKMRLSDASTMQDVSDAATSEQLDAEAEESSSASSSSDSESSDSDSDTDSDSEFGEVSQEYLDSLLEKAKASLRVKAQEKGKGKQRAFSGEEEEEEEIRLEDSEDRGTGGLSRELLQLEPGDLPPGYFDFKDGDLNEPPVLRDVEAERFVAASADSTVPAAPPAPPEFAKDGRRLTKKEKKAMKKKTAGAEWFDLPAPDPADLPRLYREVEALRLRNALDPKRFYRKEPGEGKGIKGLPEHFAIGTIITTKTPFGTTSTDNLPRAERKRTIVDELVDDAETKRYAKRKFEDLQSVRRARGRGTFAKRFASRKPKW